MAVLTEDWVDEAMRYSPVMLAPLLPLLYVAPLGMVMTAPPVVDAVHVGMEKMLAPATMTSLDVAVEKLPDVILVPLVAVPVAEASSGLTVSRPENCIAEMEEVTLPEKVAVILRVELPVMFLA